MRPIRPNRTGRTQRSSWATRRSWAGSCCAPTSATPTWMRSSGVYAGRVRAEADLVTYWFEKARAMVAAGRVRRAGLLATQGIRGGASRRVLDRICESGAIFMARSDDPWVLDGAAVHVSFVAFDDGSERERTLDGRPVAAINANLTADVDLTRARRLRENMGIAFMGDTQGRTVRRFGRAIAARLAAQPEPGWPRQPGRGAAMGQRAGPHAAPAGHVDRGLRDEHGARGGGAV